MLEQAEPPDERPVCSGEKLMYRCYAVPPSMSWQENGHGVTLTYTDTVPEFVDRFKFEVTDGNQTTIVTTATLPQAHSNDTGTKIECIDQGSILTKTVEVAREPESCVGSVVCYFRQDKLVVSLDDAPSNLMCVERFLFRFDAKNKTSDRVNSLAMFEMEETRGSVLENQSVYTLDDEGRPGPHPCLYHILAPNSVEHIYPSREHIGTKIDVHIEIERPTFPIGSCLSARDVTWYYNVTTNMSENFTKVAEDHMIYHDIPAETYEVIVVPTVVELNLKAESNYPTHIVVTELPTYTSTKIEIITVTETPTPVDNSKVVGLTAGFSIFTTTTALLVCVVAVLLVLLLKNKIQGKSTLSQTGNVAQEPKGSAVAVEYSATNPKVDT